VRTQGTPSLLMDYIDNNWRQIRLQQIYTHHILSIRTCLDHSARSDGSLPHAMAELTAITLKTQFLRLVLRQKPSSRNTGAETRGV